HTADSKTGAPIYPCFLQSWSSPSNVFAGTSQR
ncbi:hypothetical protein E2320_012986, partial [Naja naja]